jgi:predicted metal-dependent hydrolase
VTGSEAPEGDSVAFGEATIAYRLTFAPRRTLGIAVHPDSRVVVTAPPGTDPATVAALVQRRAAWILRQQRRFAAYPPPPAPRAYVSGESYRYLGRQYRLRVEAGERDGVRRGRGILVVTVGDGARPGRVRALVEGWYRAEAARVCAARLAACHPRVERLGLPYPTLRLRTMAASWGSCSRAGVVTLNPRLIQVPRACIDYVVLHELCHLREHNHSKPFYALLDQVLPDWRERRQRLNRCEIR